MEAGDVEEVLNVLDSCISRVKWRLRYSAKRRIATDILSLCTGMRAVVMVDYGGKMPELQEHVSSLLSLIRKESTILLPLRVMIIEDMIYIVHVKGLAEQASLSLSSEPQLHFVDLEQDPPKMLLHSEENMVVSELVSIQKLFASVFPIDEKGTVFLPSCPPFMIGSKAESSECKAADLDQPSDVVDLRRILEDTQLTIPTLNGWLLGYPVVYLFGKEHVTDAVYNLSTKSLHIYKIIIGRKKTSGRKPCEEELMSFTVPDDLSMRQEKELWAKAFLARLSAKLETCRQVWADMRLEVTECCPQAIVL